ncbi:hypothetical protein CNMCM5623_007304 [Aspergillus felis]|uniref:Uncharacterized protein n=1 Tax=Aspergillus felis TaxID=1287682 RepID=A0A8H6V401_9EURO|nr:hypothetical protein CNMCM5623_007304 [Aspergillus felis]
MRLRKALIGLLAARVCCASPTPNDSISEHHAAMFYSNWDFSEDPTVKLELARMDKDVQLVDPRPYQDSGWFAEANCLGGRDVEFMTRLRVLPGFKAKAVPVKQHSLWARTNPGTTDATREITTTEVKIEKDTSGWEVGSKITGGKTDKATVEVSAKYSQEWSKEQSYTIQTKDTLICEAGYACDFTPVTYKLQISGDCDKIPITTWGWPNQRYGYMDACVSPDRSCLQKIHYTKANCPYKRTQCSFEVPVFDGDKPRVTVLKLWRKADGSDDKVRSGLVDAHVL